MKGKSVAFVSFSQSAVGYHESRCRFKSKINLLSTHLGLGPVEKTWFLNRERCTVS